MARVLQSTGEALLQGAGKVSHTEALEKTKAEYRKFQAQELSPVEEAYLSTIREVEKLASGKAKNTEEYVWRLPIQAKAGWKA